MQLITAGMHRSGINAISRWLLRQSELGKNKLSLIEGDWVESDNSQKFGFVSQINHPAHDCFISYSFENCVMSIERENVARVKDIIYLNNLQHKPIFVIRDFRNWLASVFAMGGIPTRLDLDKYSSYICQYFTKSIKNNIEFILYNEWVKSRAYRMGTVRILDLFFTDCGINDVPTNGGGSSFDGMKFEGKGQEMDVLNRWKIFRNELWFKQILKAYEDIDEFSQAIFGDYE